MISGDFVFLSVAIGALGGALFSFLGLNVYWQFTGFILLSLIFYITVRPIWKRYLNKSGKDVSTNVHHLIGKEITPSELSSNGLEGYGKIYGDVWKIQHVNDAVLSISTIYIVKEVKGNRLFIEEKN